VSDVVALDTVAFRSIIDRGALADAVDVPIDSLLAGGEPIPALLVGARSGASAPRVGDVAELGHGATNVALHFGASTERFPGVPIGRPTIVVDRAALAGATDAGPVAPTFALLNDAAVFDAEVRAILDDPRVLVRWIERSDRLAAMDADPLSVWTGRSAWLLVLASVGLTAVAAAAGTVLTATTRRRDLGLLTVLGLERRAAVRLVAIELLPGVAVAAAVGVVTGAATARLLGPNLSLEVFAGDARASGVMFAWPVIVGVGGVLVLAAVVAVGVTIRSLRHVDHAMLLRRGDV
jgi:putative ABC transport system permease protein